MAITAATATTRVMEVIAKAITAAAIMACRAMIMVETATITAVTMDTNLHTKTRTTRALNLLTANLTRTLRNHILVRLLMAIRTMVATLMEVKVVTLMETKVAT